MDLDRVSSHQPTGQAPSSSSSEKWIGSHKGGTPATLMQPSSWTTSSNAFTSSSSSSRLSTLGHDRLPHSHSSDAVVLAASSGYKRERTTYGDRFIPTRDINKDLGTAYKLLPSRSCFDLGKGGTTNGSNSWDKLLNLPGSSAGPSTPRKGKRRASGGGSGESKQDESSKIFSDLLRSEMFGDRSPSSHQRALTAGDGVGNVSGVGGGVNGSGIVVGTTTPRRQRTYTAGGTPTRSQTMPGTPTKLLTPALPTTPTSGRSGGGGGSRNLFSFHSPSRSATKTAASGGGSDRSQQNSASSLFDSPFNDAYSLSPIKASTQAILQSPRKQTRPISKTPYKVLDAPELADDFYLNLVDWSSSNNLAVGLGATVYLWSGITHAVTKLCDQSDRGDLVTAVGWVGKGHHIGVGTNKGYVQIWDAESRQLIRTMKGHSQRAGSLAWNDYILSSGSRDKSILHRDVRAPTHYIAKVENGHRQEVCGLKWNTSLNQLASGGNDNKLFVWDRLNFSGPLWRFDDHTAAVKAISWSPHQQGILASGGGTQDRKIRFWNTLTGALLNEIDTGSQVCNLAFSQNSNEIVSTHGYSLNQIAIWKYPSLSPVATLTGHASRVLYLALSPDGQSIVTGAGDETLRFWNVFGKPKVRPGGVVGGGLLGDAHHHEGNNTFHEFGSNIR